MGTFQDGVRAAAIAKSKELGDGETKLTKTMTTDEFMNAITDAITRVFYTLFILFVVVWVGIGIII